MTMYPNPAEPRGSPWYGLGSRGSHPVWGNAARMGWDQAKETCESLGGDLPSVQTPRQDRFARAGVTQTSQMQEAILNSHKLLLP